MLNFSESLALFDSGRTPLHELGVRADRARVAACGDTVFYNVNAHLNPTNVCQYRCALCAYSCDAGSARAYRTTDAQIQAAAQRAVEDRCSEIHVVGGVDPELPYDWYVRLVRSIHESCPGLQIKAFTAVEIAWMAAISGKSVGGVLEDLREAGLTTLPGGGAEILVDGVRRVICARKPMSDVWLDVHRTAHGLGIPSTATILYGHVESAADRVTHLLKLRELQAETGGFMALIPLAFHPKNTGLESRVAARPSPEDDLRMVAAARLILSNVPHMKAYWVSLGLATAQVALAYGADDLDGTVRHEKIHHDAGSDAPTAVTVAQLEALIREAGRVPVERDSLYRVR